MRQSVSVFKDADWHKGDIVVMDNLRPQQKKQPNSCGKIPPYSPDLNPIEKCGRK
jgi:transposase